MKSGHREHYKNKNREPTKGSPRSVSGAWKSPVKESFSHNCSNTAKVIALAGVGQWAECPVHRKAAG